MKHLELDLKKIGLIGEQKKEENFDFRFFLKEQNSKRIDDIVRRLDKEIKSQIDCKKCGNCCKSLRPCLTESEIKRLSKIDNLSHHDFVTRFVEIEHFDEVKYLKDTPCKYLRGKICSIYPNRPKDCKSYPHTQKSDFNSRTLGMIDNYDICPIVFNLFEQLKEESGYYM